METRVKVLFVLPTVSCLKPGIIKTDELAKSQKSSAFVIPAPHLREDKLHGHTAYGSDELGDFLRGHQDCSAFIASNAVRV
ncbi:MAG: hypothetical protein DRG71_09730 [Deltaproteobacteria bacterium]|nr:MAG: hypothetical protein DRG71_09730 [Deltaproteobacteria bacterium]